MWWSDPRTCATSGRPSRCGCLPAPAPIDGTWARCVVDAFHDAHEALYGYHFRGKADQHVEWVNLRVTGIGPLPRPPLRRVPDSRGADAALVSRRRGLLR